jgi:hypothetical protein
MNRMRRALGIVPVVALVLAACAGQGTGSGATEDDAAMPSGSHAMASSTGPAASEAATTPAASADESAAAAGDDRVAIDDVLADPAAFEDQEITISENVDEVFLDGAAFLFSGTEVEGQLLVVATPETTVNEQPEANRVITVTGTLVPFTAEDLEAAGAAIAIDDAALGDFSGNAALVAAETNNPLGQ